MSLNRKEYEPVLRKQLIAGTYRFDTLQKIRACKEIIALWSERDALVLKAMTIVLGEFLKPTISARCFHMKGNGVLKAAAIEAMKYDCFVMN